MKIKINLFCYLFLFGPFLSIYAQGNFRDVVYTQEDMEIVDRYLTHFHEQKGKPVGELIVSTGEYFLGSPYLSSTLETPEKEMLVVNLREFDCTTFVESCLALVGTLKLTAHHPEKSLPENFALFCEQLKEIRYRDGKMEDYSSRLHYFSDWIYNNEKKGFVKDVTSQAGGKKKNMDVNYMSTHPDSYKQLVSDPSLVERIRKTEEEINSRNMYYYIPKAEIRKNKSHIRNGDIVAFTTGISGLDVSHVGFAVWKNGELHLMHASLSGEVLITKQSLVEYTSGIKRQTGIMLARPVEK